VIQPPSQAGDARVTFVVLYHFKYSLRHLLNRLINLRMIGASEGVREHGVHLAKGRPGAPTFGTNCRNCSGSAHHLNCTFVHMVEN